MNRQQINAVIPKPHVFAEPSALHFIHRDRLGEHVNERAISAHTAKDETAICFTVLY